MAQGRKTPLRIVLTKEERTELERRSRSLVEEHRVVVRAHMILDLSVGKTLAWISSERGLAKRIVRKWGARFEKKRLPGLDDGERSGRPTRFSPSITLELVKRACELPDSVGRSLSVWTCAELARSLREDGVVGSISPQSVQRMLNSQKLKPWRVHHWLSSKVPRDEDFYGRVTNIRDLYTRQLEPHERVLSLDEKTSLQPRTRTTATKPAQANKVPVRLEHEYVRKGAFNLFAAFDTRTGEVFGILRRRKRQLEFLELLEKIDAETPAHITKIHLVCDNVSIHHGKTTRSWLTAHPRFSMHFTPVHCSWMNQVEQWFSILQRKRLVAANFDNLNDLEQKIFAFIKAWNAEAHPLKWTPASFDKILSKRVERMADAA